MSGNLRIAILVAAVFSTSALAYEQGGPVGTWSGETDGRGGGGPGILTVILNADGTGRMIGTQGAESELSEVMIEGTLVSFHVGAGNQTVPMTGEVDADELTLNFVSPPRRAGPGPFAILTRQ